jgi:hypothetical protein
MHAIMSKIQVVKTLTPPNFTSSNLKHHHLVHSIVSQSQVRKVQGTQRCPQRSGSQFELKQLIVCLQIGGAVPNPLSSCGAKMSKKVSF